MLHWICQQIWKTQQWPQDWKRSVFIPIPKGGNAKECSNYRTMALISHASKVVLKILQARFQQYVNWELSYVQARYRKSRGTKDQIANICWIIEKAREFQKNIYFCLHAISKMTEWSVRFQGKPFNITVIQVFTPTSYVEEAEAEWFYEDLQDISRINTQKRCPFHYRGLEGKSRKSRDTWSNSQVCSWSTEWSRAKANRVLPREHTGHSKHPLPTTQHILHMDINRWSMLKSDWLYSLQPKMEKLCTVSKSKAWSWVWLRS